MTTLTDRDTHLHHLEGYIETVANLSDVLQLMGFNEGPIPSGAVLEIGTALKKLAGEMRESWEIAAGADGR